MVLKRKHSSAEELLESPKRSRPVVEETTTPVSSHGDIFSFCPAEIKIQVFNLLDEIDTANLSRCSRSFYAFSWGLRFKSVILDEKSIKIFQTGGLGEHGCHHISSVRLGKKYKWSKNASKLGAYFCGDKVDTNGALDQIRAVLALFPNLRRFSLSYHISTAAENNTYVAIFNEISRHPTMWSSLEYLRIEAVKVPEMDPKGCYRKSGELYKKLYRELSVENQKFLGDKVADGEVGKLLKEKLETQGFPNLKKVKIAANCLAGPMSDPKSAYMKRTGFYYIPLLFAPQLQTLTVETTDSCHIFDTYGFTVRDDLKGRAKADFEAGLLDVFSKIKKLSLTTYDSPKPKDIQRLAYRFPNLTTLKIKMFNDRPCDGYTNNRIPYTSIKDLKHLETLNLPWPRSEEGCFKITRLQGQVKTWKQSGLDSLEMIDFRGKKDKATGFARVWSDTHAGYRIRFGAVYPCGDTSGYEDNHRRKLAVS
ncbi:hypothetical protein TWF106_009516 [Orbilia oligospora]|uniref:F-box domain-containing protein n=2 Tax=Orbilia oligospora TaxID=2813651 RepID=A0A6G1MJH3_ORBOL|nr:hypothetical protein TWF679_010719 [Orbilia oligospora]KAF3213389.1 hypothetical protein TWF106_009516 [Orbilia oligospora]KAF3260611.1 hypothetical protein TWF192_009892 [Orbilia oligospora]